MVKNKKTIIFFIIFLLFIVYQEFQKQNHISYKKPPKSILKLDSTILNSYMHLYDANRSLNIYWGISEPVVKKIIQKKNNKKPHKTTIKKQKDKNVLCINKSCYELMGIYQNKHERFVSLYNKDLNKSLNSYRVGDTICSLLKVTKLKSNLVVFSEINATNKWYFKLFDVNITKYKPKEITP